MCCVLCVLSHSVCLSPIVYYTENVPFEKCHRLVSMLFLSRSAIEFAFSVTVPVSIRPVSFVRSHLPFPFDSFWPKRYVLAVEFFGSFIFSLCDSVLRCVTVCVYES